LYPYQLGFYSLYLPGYTYRPLFLAMPTVVRSPMVYAPRTGSTYALPRPLGSVYTAPTAVRPLPSVRPMSAPAARAPVAVPHGGGHK
jgi:hypothetical protein